MKLEKGKREVNIFQATDLVAKFFDALYELKPHQQLAVLARGLAKAASRAAKK